MSETLMGGVEMGKESTEEFTEDEECEACLGMKMFPALRINGSPIPCDSCKGSGLKSTT